MFSGLEVKMQKKMGGVRTISTTIGNELYEQCKLYGIGWSEALRRGATLMLSTLPEAELYRNRHQLQLQVVQFKDMLEKTSFEKYKVEEELNKLKEKEVKQ